MVRKHVGKCASMMQVHLYKPATSKEGNSEVYVICLGYVGRQEFEPQLKLMKEQIGKNL